MLAWRDRGALDGGGVGSRAVARRAAAGLQVAHPADPRPALLVLHDLGHHAPEQVVQCAGFGRGQAGQQGCEVRDSLGLRTVS
jgi:hypothetical protein